jgi:hypothetical protein
MDSAMLHGTAHLPEWPGVPVAGGYQEVKPELAEEARKFLLQPSIVRGTFAYWARRCPLPACPT